MKTRRICFIISILLVAPTLFAHQEETAIDRVIEQIYDFLMEDIDDEAAIDYGDLYDDLTAIYESPINLNTATPEELAKVRFLSDIQIENLMTRSPYGCCCRLYVWPHNTTKQHGTCAM